ncbi:MAG: APC family permease, partial [Chloroflexota bacterium]
NAVIGTTFSMGLIFLLMLLNIFGVKETSFMNILAATTDLLMQFIIVVLGFVFLLNPNQLIEQMRLSWPSPQNLILGIALATMAYTGVETISQMAEEARRPRFRVPRALMLMVATVLVMFFGISLVAFSTMTPQELVSQWAKDPVAGIAQHLPEQLASMTFTDPAVAVLFKRFSDILTSVLPAVVALLAATILLLATNAGLMGISRLAFSMGKNRQIPDAFCRIHSKFKTPYLSIIVFTLVALLLLIPAPFSPRFLLGLGVLYTFSALVINALAHLSIIALRVKYPNLQRPFKLPFSFRVAGREIPPTAVLGLLISLSIWLVILYYQPSSFWGLAWMGLGLVLYI